VRVSLRPLPVLIRAHLCSLRRLARRQLTMDRPIPQHLPHRPGDPERCLPVSLPQRHRPRDVWHRRQGRQRCQEQGPQGGRPSPVLVQLLLGVQALQGAFPSLTLLCGMLLSLLPMLLTLQGSIPSLPLFFDRLDTLRHAKGSPRSTLAGSAASPSVTKRASAVRTARRSTAPSLARADSPSTPSSLRTRW